MCRTYRKRLVFEGFLVATCRTDTAALLESLCWLLTCRSAASGHTVSKLSSCSPSTRETTRPEIDRREGNNHSTVPPVLTSIWSSKTNVEGFRNIKRR